MNIRKAIIKARAKQKGITRQKWMPYAATIIPTNTSSCFILVPFDEDDRIGRRWNPTAEDILANDWQITG
ncbi:Thoeris anti-defense Tad2 family protein [Companilactobacillus nuruki]|uniref:Thoeris anti-defense 2-like domain-containing protein n=1 Tax=Companilactobacillus nuruki TaxID=1993540 RepID=A0A2N7AV21_9LACO|nr:MW1434 family type I TA system toxin [Companilactobacillus nuruki]PMD71464.1 hypothetical protein CBP76_04960 [Companilactobacillus nuruki]